jgi:hypothetical protein
MLLLLLLLLLVGQCVGCIYVKEVLFQQLPASLLACCSQLNVADGQLLTKAYGPHTPAQQSIAQHSVAQHSTAQHAPITCTCSSGDVTTPD